MILVYDPCIPCRSDWAANDGCCFLAGLYGWVKRIGMMVMGDDDVVIMIKMLMTMLLVMMI